MNPEGPGDYKDVVLLGGGHIHAEVLRQSGMKTLPGARLTLVPFGQSHITARYLAWLSDDEVNRYSRRFSGSPITADEAQDWLESLAADEHVFAIEAPEFGHIGNIKYGPVNQANLAADLSIVIGDVASWGKGFGAEATYLVSRHLFLDRGLNRLSAASINPAFIRMAENLGWRREGVQREEARVDGIFHDSILLSMLRRDFRAILSYEESRR